MTATKRRTYRQETLDAIVRRFDAAPTAPEAPEQYRTPALVRKLVPKIHEMLGKGYTWDVIAQMMADDGVHLSPSVLRKYASGSLDKAKPRKKAKGGTKRGPGPLALRRRPALNEAGSPAGSKATASAHDILAPDDAWDELEPIDETDLKLEDAPPTVIPQVPSAIRANEPRKVPNASPVRPSFRTRPEGERR